MTEKEIKELVYSLGADVCGIADIGRFIHAPQGFHPTDILPNAKSVIVFGKQFSKGLFDAKTNVPYTLARNKILDMMDDISLELSFKMENEGYMVVPIPSAEPYEFWDSQRRHGCGILSMKHAAELAGLGCIGKNTLLVNEQYGNRLWLGAVIADVVFEPDELTKNLCPENCRICLEACPQSALDGITINQKKCREISASSTDGGGWVLSCNTCRKACPFSRV